MMPIKHLSYHHGHPRSLYRCSLCLILMVMLSLSVVEAFSVGPTSTTLKRPTMTTRRTLPTSFRYWSNTAVTSTTASLSKTKFNQNQVDRHHPKVSFATATTTTWIASILLFLAVSTSSPTMAFADESELTVKNTITKLKEAQGNPDGTFSVFEDVAAMITEGKGIGGAINYQGIKLDRGYVADEDTSIYNPGLTLLTEGEKEQLVQAILDSRRAGLQQNQWTENNQVAFDFLKGSLDPFHLSELRGYLNFLPIYIAIWYLGTLAVQQIARQWFAVAYLVAAAAIFVPALVLVAVGPQ